MSLKTPEDVAALIRITNHNGTALADLIRERDKAVRLALLADIERLADMDSPKGVLSYQFAIRTLRAKYEAERGGMCSE